VTDKPITTAEEMREAAILATARMPMEIPRDPRAAYHAALDAVEAAIRALPVAAPDPLDDPRVRTLVEALEPFSRAWGIACASGQTSMVRLGSLARDEVPGVCFMRARAALAAFEKDRTDD
jgi:hypothetical protein